MTPRFRNILQFIFFSLLLICLVVLAFYTDSTSRVGVIALIIAVFSLIVTTISLNQVNDAKLPQIVVDVDFESRYDLMLLKVENLGEKPAFDVEIK